MSTIVIPALQKRTLRHSKFKLLNEGHISLSGKTQSQYRLTAFRIDVPEHHSACKRYLEWSYLKKQKVEWGVAQIWERSGGEGIIV